MTTITLDPNCRFPDRNPSDNVWPKPAARLDSRRRHLGRAAADALAAACGG